MRKLWIGIVVVGLASTAVCLEVPAKAAQETALSESKIAAVSVHEAIYARDIVQLRRAIAAHPDQVNAPFNSELPLGLAVAQRNLPAVEALLSAGANPNKKGGSGRSAMDFSAELPKDGQVVSAIRRKLVQAGGIFSLSNAVQMGDLLMARRLLKDDPKSVKSTGPYGDSPLYTAVSTRNMKAARLLLEAGANPNARKSKDHSPLRLAVQLNQLAMVTLLIKHGADVNQVDQLGLRPLYYALMKGYVPVARTLMAKQPRLTLNEAVALRSLAKVRQTILSGAVKHPSRRDLGPTPLHTMAVNGDVAIAKALIDAGFDVNASAAHPVPWRVYGMSRTTPLEVAAEYGHKELVELLLARGADPRKGNALHQAVVRGDLAMAEALIGSGADVNAAQEIRFAQSATPLYLAAKSDNLRMASLLLTKGAQPDRPSMDTGLAVSAIWNCQDLTPLHVAARLRDPDMARLLLDGGADVNAKNAAGSTPLDTAALIDKNSPVSKLLRERGGKLSTQSVRFE